MLFLITLATFCSTFLGGIFALRLRDKLHLVSGFSAGAVIGLAFFDLLPETLDLGAPFYSSHFLTLVIAAGFITYMIIDRFIALHGHTHDEHDHYEPQQERGSLGAGSLSVHSFLDGLAIGLAFQVSVSVGVVVAIAVLVHDFSDGINTVNFILKNNGARRSALWWLIVDAIAPIAGVVVTLFFTLPEDALSLVLAVFTGFFLYIGACDLLPESQHSHPRILTTILTMLGIAVMFVAVSLARF